MERTDDFGEGVALEDVTLLAPGDMVAVTVDGLGTLEKPLTAEGECSCSYPRVLQHHFPSFSQEGSGNTPATPRSVEVIKRPTGRWS